MTEIQFIRRVTSVLVLSAAIIGGCKQPAPTPQVVDIKAADGLLLKATLFPSSKPGPAVLLLHQCDEQRKVWDSLGVRLMNSGMSALSVDYRGYGESGGTPHDKLAPAELNTLMSVTWPTDIDSAFAFLSRQPGVDTARMAVGGGSCGANNAVHVAIRHNNVKALALLAGGIDREGRNYLATAGSPPVFTGAAQDDKYANFVDIMGWVAGLSSNSQTRMLQYADGGHAAVVFKSHPDFPDSIAKWYSAVLLNKPELLPVTNGKPMNAEVLQALHEMDQPGGATTVQQKLVLARKQNLSAQLFPEFYANVLGYEHMQMNDSTGAIAIMKLNTVAYPNSPNAMDSLGDVYLAAGDKKSALQAAKQALLLVARDTTDTEERKQNIRTSAEQKIKQLTPP